MDKKKFKIDWSKAPKLSKNAILIGHTFSSDGYGYWEYLEPAKRDFGGGSMLENYSKNSYIEKPKDLNWKDSWMPAPVKNKRN